MHILLIALGGALGALSRYGLGALSTRLGTDGRFPFATLTANLTGCFLIGMLAPLVMRLAAREGGAETATLIQNLLIIGFLGSLTTFSTFSLQTGRLLTENWPLAMVNIVVSLAGGLALTAAGHYLVTGSFRVLA